MKVNTKKKAIEANIQDRRNRVSELLLDGKAYRQIAQLLDIPSLKTVHDDVHAIFAEWREERVKNADKYMLVELDRLLFVLKEAEEQWLLSKDRERTRTTTRRNGKGEQGETTVEVTKLSPDAKYLDVIVKASERLCRMLGVDKVKEIKLSGKIERSEEFKFVLEAGKKIDLPTRRAIMQLLEGQVQPMETARAKEEDIPE